jgi:PAS domain S-box-containing protein
MADFKRILPLKKKELRSNAEVYLAGMEPALIALDDLKSSKTHYKDLFECAPVGYLTLDSKGIVLEINLTAAKLLGNERKKIINRPFDQFIPITFKKKWYRFFSQTLESKVINSCEIPFKLKKGIKRDYRLVCFNSDLKSNRPVFQILILQEINPEFNNSEISIGAAAFKTHEALVIADSKCRILSVNPAFTRITGYNANEATKLSFLNNIPQYIDSFKIKRSDLAENEFWHGELQEYRKNGDLIDLSLYISSIADNKGGISNYIFAFTDITDRKKVEVKFKVLNRDFVAFLENATDFIYFKDSSNHFRFCSNSLAESVGLKRWQNVVGKHLFDIFPEDVAKNYSDAEQVVLQKGIPLLNNLEPHYDSTGRKSWVSTSKWPLFDDNGKVIGIFGFSRDVTSQKVLEEALRASEASYRSVLENQTEMICRFKADGTVVYVNEAFCKAFGKSKEEFIGNIRYPVALPDDIPYINQKLSFLTPNNPICTVENRIVMANGNIRWGQFVNRAFYDSEGNFLELQSVGRDITEQKLTEESLRIAAVAFETQEGIIVADAEKSIQRVNKAFSRLTGYSAEEAKKLPLINVNSHDIDFEKSIWTSVAQNGHWQGEIRYQHKNGNKFYAWFNIAVSINENGKITHYIASFQDISAQKQAEKVLLEERKRLENQVISTQAELEKNKQENSDINLALAIVLKHQETKKVDDLITFSNEIQMVVFPMLERLKKASDDPHKAKRLIDVLEVELKQLLNSCGRVSSLAAAFQLLTPVERKVATMVKEGYSTKEIATTLNLSTQTIDVHRKHIRKKFGLSGKTGNLNGYLLSLTE